MTFIYQCNNCQVIVIEKELPNHCWRCGYATHAEQDGPTFHAFREIPNPALTGTSQNKLSNGRSS